MQKSWPKLLSSTSTEIMTHLVSSRFSSHSQNEVDAIRQERNSTVTFIREKHNPNRHICLSVTHTSRCHPPSRCRRQGAVPEEYLRNKSRDSHWRVRLEHYIQTTEERAPRHVSITTSFQEYFALKVLHEDWSAFTPTSYSQVSA